MREFILRITVFSLLVAALAVPSSQAFGQEKKGKGQKEQAERAPNKQGVIPFRGKIGAVDKTAKTITVGERVFQITSETKLMKAEKPATLGDAAVGEEIRGSYKKADDGKLLAQRVWIGPRPQVEKKAVEAGKEAPKREGIKKGDKGKKETTAQ